MKEFTDLHKGFKEFYCGDDYLIEELDNRQFNILTLIRSGYAKLKKINSIKNGESKSLRQ